MTSVSSPNLLMDLMDDGDERDEYGKFVAPRNPEQQRVIQKPKGDTKKKFTRVFSSEFWERINPKIYDEVDEPDAMDVSEYVSVDLSMKEAGTTRKMCTTTIVILDGGKLEVPEALPGPSRMIDPDSLPVEYYQLPLIDAIAVFRHFGLSDPMDEAWKKGILYQAPLEDYFSFGENLLFLMTTEILKDVGKTERFISVGWEALVEDAVKEIFAKERALCEGFYWKMAYIAVRVKETTTKKTVVLDPYVIFPMTKLDVDVAYRAQLRAYLENFTPPPIAVFAGSWPKMDSNMLRMTKEDYFFGVTDTIGLRLNNMPVSFVPYDRAVRSNDKQVLAQLREENKNCVRVLQKLFNKRVGGRKSVALFTPKDFLEEAELQMQKLKVQVEQKNKQAKQDEAAIEQMKNELPKGIHQHAQKLQEVATG
ncbi:unnamed protein product [Orchesella dallaii]|uniref:Uncharacterized protein n=1 Tax=Orchesella dallaii TaxID=48710 RepID=A0ABP1RNT0_9HEXA